MRELRPDSACGRRRGAGLVLVCDHTPFDDSPRSIALYMTEQEQQKALADARFTNVQVELAMNGLILYAGERTTEFWSG
jgi:hypothetical protein